MSNSSRETKTFSLLADDDESIKTSSKDKHYIPLNVFRKTRRLTKFNPHGERSKYICVPRQIKESGTHMVHEYLVGSNLNVPTNISFVHHYRLCPLDADSVDCANEATQVDRTAYKYKDMVVYNIKNVMAILAEQCAINHLFV